MPVTAAISVVSLDHLSVRLLVPLAAADYLTALKIPELAEKVCLERELQLY